jgi:uncharacterized protein (DUF1697 family)
MVVMKTYVILLRGINVGGKNKISMTELKRYLEELGYQNIATYISSGNVILDTDDSIEMITDAIQNMLIKKFKLDSALIKALVLTHNQLETIVNKAPKSFGKHPDTYYSDVLFVIGSTSSEVISQIETHPDVDAAWEGNGVVYFQRLSTKRTKSRLGRIAVKPIYKNITIRSWNTTTKLLNRISDRGTI